MTDDNEPYRRRLLETTRKYAEVYPSVPRRIEEMAQSTDPYLVEFVEALTGMQRVADRARESWFADRYGLTPKEARIATHLATGGSVSEYASMHGVSEQTVRSQLKSVFAKTGVNRQAALAGLLTGELRSPNSTEE